EAERPDGWWASLNHGGLLIAPAKLAEHFAAPPPPLPAHLAELLRRDVTRVLSGEGDHVSTLIDTVLEKICGIGPAGFTRGSNVGRRFSRKAVTGETIRPRRVWEDHGGRLAVFVPDGARTGRIGVGRGRRDVARVVEWLRKSDEKIALLTNGREWRLIYAGPDHEAWCEWDSARFFEEGAPSAQVTALRALLNRDTLSSPGGAPCRLVRAIQESRSVEAEISSALGEGVRR